MSLPAMTPSEDEQQQERETLSRNIFGHVAPGRFHAEVASDSTSDLEVADVNDELTIPEIRVSASLVSANHDSLPIFSMEIGRVLRRGKSVSCKSA
jgi:hypothetical protein